jgi:hypothetical protein
MNLRKIPPNQRGKGKSAKPLMKRVEECDTLWNGKEMI